MLRSRFLWQLCGALAAIILVSTLVFAFVASSQVQTDARNTIRASLVTQAAVLRQLLLPNLLLDEAISTGELAAITGDPGQRITLIDARGVVLADSREDPEVMDNHGRRPEIVDALASGMGQSERFSHTLQQNMLYVALRVDGESGPLGYVRLAVPLESVDRQLAALRNQIFISGAAIAGIFLVVGFFFARRFTIPVTRMTEGAASIARGHYDLRLPEGRGDEIGELAVALNALARGTEERIDALTGSRNQLAAILSGLTEGVIAVDLEQKILHINDAARQMLDLQHRELAGVPLWEVVRASEICRVVDACLSELATVNGTAMTGGRTLDASCVLLRGEGGPGAAGAIVVLQDVTEMRHLEQVRSDFVANASHELKTPISAIRGFVETIVDDPDMTDDVLHQFVERIGSQAKRLDNIVQDLIHLSRFDTHQRDITLSRVDVGSLLERVYRQESDDAREAGVDFRLDLPDEPVEVEGEQQALVQMVTNLVDNAIKYSKAAGEVVLRLRAAGQTAVIEVEDNGIGIPAEEQQRIFERFYRVDRARSREKGGTGLGLAIVKHIAQSHNGSVTVDSRVDKGSLFTVRLPLASRS
jgi:two-component system phosphate regulon sensor histidine kinase PhoR